MIQQTLNGVDIIITEYNNEFIIYYEGETIRTKERPVTDQDILKLKRENEDRLIFEITNNLIECFLS